MGTRSLTVFVDEDGAEIVVMYRQMDGYVEGHGIELAELLSKGKLVNGFGLDDQTNFNGMGCLAAQVVSHFKEGIGSFYLYPAGTRDAGEDYVYTVRPSEDPSKTEIKVESGYGKGTIFTGSPEQLVAFAKETSS